MTVDTSRLVRRHQPCLACWTCSNARPSSPVHAGPSRQSTGRAPFAAGPRTTTRPIPTRQRRFSSRGVCRPSRTGSAYAPSSRLVQAVRGIDTAASRCYAGFHHGLLEQRAGSGGPGNARHRRVCVLGPGGAGGEAPRPGEVSRDESHGREAVDAGGPGGVCRTQVALGGSQRRPIGAHRALWQARRPRKAESCYLLRPPPWSYLVGRPPKSLRHNDAQHGPTTYFTPRHLLRRRLLDYSLRKMIVCPLRNEDAMICIYPQGMIP